MLNNLFLRLKNIDRTEKSGIINMAIKPISLILSLIYTPLLLEYLGTEKYGLWATVLSIISWINYFDVGIGNGLRNALSKYIENKNYTRAKEAVSTAYVTLSVISLCLLSVSIIISLLLDWKIILTTQINMRYTIIISIVFVCINFVLSLSNTLLYALQKTEGVAIRGCLIQIINILGIIILTHSAARRIEYIAVLFGLSTFIVCIVSTYYIIKKNKYLRPGLKSYNKDCIPEICSKGLQFFVIQIMCLLMFTVDNVLISHYFGASAVTPFSVANKIYNIAYSFLAAFLVPYWSGTTAAIENNNIAWIKKSIKKTVMLLIAYIAGSVVLTIVFRTGVGLWLGKDLEFEPGLIPLMCVFYIFYSILAIECQFINGSGELKTQLIMYIILGTVNIPFSIILGVTMGMNSFGIRLATTILVLISDIVLGINLRNIIKKLENKS